MKPYIKFIQLQVRFLSCFSYCQSAMNKEAFDRMSSQINALRLQSLYFFMWSLATKSIYLKLTFQSFEINGENEMWLELNYEHSNLISISARDCVAVQKSRVRKASSTEISTANFNAFHTLPGYKRKQF